MTQSTPHTEQAAQEISAERDPLPGASYETRDVNWRSMIALGIGIIVMVVTSQVVAWGLLDSFRIGAKKSDPEITPLAKDIQRANVPPLQSQPNREYHEFALAQEAELAGYSAPNKAGRLRIPIERAMDLIAQRGVAAPAKAPDGKAKP